MSRWACTGFSYQCWEAISNAMHGVEERFGEDGRTNGTVDIHFHDWNNPSKFKVSVSDNGAGLNDENYRSFKTPFTGHKLRLKGRGFGRFIAFKVFACQSAFKFDPAYCRISKCYPDGTDARSTDRPRQVAFPACSTKGAVGGSGPT
ncbi:hypothetical protein ACVWZK_007201 [Bradyrhizobium sp. GM0.4]